MKTFIHVSYVLCLFSSVAAQAQNSIVKPNTAYFELLGNGGLYSVNYERFLIQTAKQAYGIRVGGSYWSPKTPYFNIIGEFVGLIGSGKHHADLGLGLTGGSAPNRDVTGYQSQSHLYAVPRIGYRYQKPEGGTMIRLGINPFLPLTSGTPSKATSYPLYVGLGGFRYNRTENSGLVIGGC